MAKEFRSCPQRLSPRLPRPWPGRKALQPQNARQLRCHRNRSFDLIAKSQGGIEMMRVEQSALSEFTCGRLMTEAMVG